MLVVEAGESMSGWKISYIENLLDAIRKNTNVNHVWLLIYRNQAEDPIKIDGEFEGE